MAALSSENGAMGLMRHPMHHAIVIKFGLFLKFFYICSLKRTIGPKNPKGQTQTPLSFVKTILYP